MVAHRDMDVIWQQSGPLAVTHFDDCHFTLFFLWVCVCLYGMHANASWDKQQHMKSITASPLVIHNIPSILSRSQRTLSCSASVRVNTVIVFFLLFVPPFQQLKTAATQSTHRSHLILCICFSFTLYLYIQLLYSSITYTENVREQDRNRIALESALIMKAMW